MMRRVCHICNAKSYEPNARFCHICGAELSGTISSAQRDIEPVDLGLPSGTKWANMNIGAVRPEDMGGYFAWGDIKEKESYDWSTYIHCNGTDDGCYNLGNTICGTKYDVAYMRSGGIWRLPSLEQLIELVGNCLFEWIFVGNTPGGRFTSIYNDQSIFLPAAGVRFNSRSGCLHSDGRYWSGTPGSDFDHIACALNFDNQGAHASNGWGAIWSNRYLGQSVRPVLNA